MFPLYTSLYGPFTRESSKTISSLIMRGPFKSDILFSMVETGLFCNGHRWYQMFWLFWSLFLEQLLLVAMCKKSARKNQFVKNNRANQNVYQCIYLGKHTAYFSLLVNGSSEWLARLTLLYFVNNLEYFYKLTEIQKIQMPISVRPAKTLKLFLYKSLYQHVMAVLRLFILMRMAMHASSCRSMCNGFITNSDMF